MPAPRVALTARNRPPVGPTVVARVVAASSETPPRPRDGSRRAASLRALARFRGRWPDRDRHPAARRAVPGRTSRRSASRCRPPAPGPGRRARRRSNSRQRWQKSRADCRPACTSPAFSRRFTNSCSSRIASTETSGRSSGKEIRTGRAPSCFSSRVSAAPTTSSSGTQSRLTTRAPDSRRVISRRFLTRRSRRSASSQIVSSSSVFSGSEAASRRSRRVVAAPVMAANGVRRSCDIALRRALRISSVRARKSASVARCS